VLDTWVGHQWLPCLSQWLSGLICFLSHSTCWAYLAGDLQGPWIKSGLRHELSVGWTNGRYAKRLISRTGTVSSVNCDRCRLWSYDITAGYKCEYYYCVQCSVACNHLCCLASAIVSNKRTIWHEAISTTVCSSWQWGQVTLLVHWLNSLHLHCSNYSYYAMC